MHIGIGGRELEVAGSIVVDEQQQGRVRCSRPSTTRESPMPGGPPLLRSMDGHVPHRRRPPTRLFGI